MYQSILACYLLAPRTHPNAILTRGSLALSSPYALPTPILSSPHGSHRLALFTQVRYLRISPPRGYPQCSRSLTSRPNGYVSKPQTPW